MNWYQHADTVDQLAGAYVLGTLQGGARRRFESAMQSQPVLAAAVNGWNLRMSPLLTTLPAMAPAPAVWQSIAQRAGIAGPAPASSGGWWRKFLAPIPLSALAMGLVLGTVVPLVWQMQVAQHRQSQLPESYVGVLANAQGQPGLIVSSLRHGTVVEIKQITAVALPPGQHLHLWRIDKAGAMTSLGTIPGGKWVRLALSEPAEKIFFSAVELAVSIEPDGDVLPKPSSAFVYRGLCGKLWP